MPLNIVFCSQAFSPDIPIKIQMKENSSEIFQQEELAYSAVYIKWPAFHMS